jgi:hypothetical protein
MITRRLMLFGGGQALCGLLIGAAVVGMAGKTRWRELDASAGCLGGGPGPPGQVVKPHADNLWRHRLYAPCRTSNGIHYFISEHRCEPHQVVGSVCLDIY